MTTRRSPEQVHEQDGHPAPVASCSLCHPEPAETGTVGELGPEPAAELAEGGVVTEVSFLAKDGPPPLVLPAPRSRSGECATDGCTGRGSHHGLCHDCHTRPGRNR